MNDCSQCVLIYDPSDIVEVLSEMDTASTETFVHSWLFLGVLKMS